MARTYQELEAENVDLRAKTTELETRLADAEKQIQQQAAVIEERNARIDKLLAALEAAERSGKRQAAPFRKADGPKAEPKKPGRRSGRRHGPHAHRGVPPRIDEHYDVPLPGLCPHCGGRHVDEIDVTPQYQTEIPRTPIYRQFDIHVGLCADCGGRVQGRHELQTSDAVGAAGSHLGPDAHAALVILNKDLGLSHGKVTRVFGSLFGIPIARATSVRSILRTARRAGAAYAQLRLDVRASRWVVCPSARTSTASGPSLRNAGF